MNTPPTPSTLYRVWYFNHESRVAAFVELPAHDRDEACARFHRQFPAKDIRGRYKNRIRRIQEDVQPGIIVQTRKPRKGGL